MQLSKHTLEKIDSRTIDAPSADYFNLPEKVLQFGTGVLLRGLPDYYIDKANKQKIFNGRIVIVKSTESGSTEAFAKQDNLYTLIVRGIDSGKAIEENIVNASISRVLSARNDWHKILKCAANSELQVIISNTTEVGIQLVKDNVHASPPESFPGKLVAFLYQRYKIFNGDVNKGFVVIPTELIINNGSKLLAIVLELAHQNGLEYSFLDWLENANDFCNSLVDRIVPGNLNPLNQKDIERTSGYTDELMTMAEAYNLWAIETSNEKTKEILSFSKADSGVVVVPDISVFMELKLRLLNGVHTLSCGLAHLAGFTTVKEAMSNSIFSKYISDLMYEEVAPAIVGDNISIEEASVFASKVLDRFRNPYMEHQWLSITVQYTSKMAMRNVYTIKKYAERFKVFPSNMALGFAGYLLFTKPVEAIDGKYYGFINKKKYLINDDKAPYYYDLWQSNHVDDVVIKSLSDETLWSDDLSAIDGFADAVENYLMQLMNDGVTNTIEQFIVQLKKNA